MHVPLAPLSQHPLIYRGCVYLDSEENSEENDKTDEHKMKITMIALFDIKNIILMNQTLQVFQL